MAKKKTKNYVKYKKNYITINGEKCAPFRMELHYEDYDYSLEEKIVALADRNSGVKTGSGYYDIEFDFFTKKGLKQFLRKVNARYDVEVSVYELQPDYQEVDPTYV